MAPRFRRTDRQVYRHVAGEHLLIDLHSKAAAPFFAITATAVPLWQALEQWQSEEQLAARLVERHGIDEERALADVRDFLEQLDTIGAVTRREETE